MILCAFIVPLHYNIIMYTMTERIENSNEEKKNLSFVEQIIEQDLAEVKNGGRLQTRFPP